MSNERDLVAWTRYPASYARRSSDLNCGLPKIAATTGKGVGLGGLRFPGGMTASFRRRPSSVKAGVRTARETAAHTRSEEHTSELQSRGDLVCRLLLEK